MSSPIFGYRKQRPGLAGPSRHVVVVRKHTGLGSDLVSVLGGIANCVATDRDLVIDWRRSRYLKDRSANAFGLLFEPVTSIDGVNVRLADRHFDDGALPGPVRTFTRRNRTSGDLHEELAKAMPVRESAIVRRTMHVLPAPETQRRWLAQIQPVDRIRSAMDSFAQARFGGRPVIGVHIRHGNGENLLQRRNELIGTGVDALVDLAADAIERLQPPSDAVLFVCTDSQELRAAFMRRFANAVHYGSRIGTAGSGPIHTSRFGLTGADDAVAEMWLLSRCDWLLYTPSWFTHHARTTGTFRSAPVNLDAVSTYAGARPGRAPQLHWWERLARRMAPWL